MRLPATVGAGEDQPPLGILSVFFGDAEGLFQVLPFLNREFVSAQVEALKGLIGMEGEAGELRLILGQAAASEIGGEDGVDSAKVVVVEARPQSQVYLLQGAIGGDDRR